MVRQRVRIRFAKTGDVRLISHRDLVRTLERLFRRADLPLSMSEGFHPKPRMTFPSALALGIAAEEEVMELELSETPDADALLARLRAQAPPGLVLKSLEMLAPGAPKARIESVVYSLPVPSERRAAVGRKIDELKSRPALCVAREGRDAPVDLLADLEELTLSGDALRLRMRAGGEVSARPSEWLAALDLADLESQGCHWTRTEVRLAEPSGSPTLPNRKNVLHEAGNVDQRGPGGGVPDRDC